MTVMQEQLRQAEIELPQLQEQNKSLTEQNLALSKQIETLKNTIESERAKQTASAKEKRQLLHMARCIYRLTVRYYLNRGVISP